MAKPYSLPPSVATVLARICCFDGILPQGAPTSPVVSNMICGRLDAELKKLAREHRCMYTRYADDITFSTYKKIFPRGLAYFEPGTGGQLVVGVELNDVIQRNSFAINSAKVRLQHCSKRQEVTGLICNQKVNVPQSYVRQIRAMLHAWTKYGLDAAASEFFLRYDPRKRVSSTVRDDGTEWQPSTFARVVKGKIDFVGQVKGKQSRPYLVMLKKYAQLQPSYTLPADFPLIETDLAKLRSAVWVLEGDETQGTAFCLQGVGLVTCHHVISENLTAFRPGEATRFRVMPRVMDEDRDLAVLSFVDNGPETVTFTAAEFPVRELDQVTLLGFPNYAPGNSGIVYGGAVIGEFVRFGQKRIQVSCEITRGSSGGPVLDASYRVIGIAANGKERLGKRGDELYGVIPIQTLTQLTNISEGN